MNPYEPRSRHDEPTREHRHTGRRSEYPEEPERSQGRFPPRPSDYGDYRDNPDYGYRGDLGARGSPSYRAGAYGRPGSASHSPGFEFGETRSSEEPGSRSFRGRGPKGYQRSDQRIYEDICDRLSDDPRLDCSNIEVRVEGGEVTLEGQLHDRGMKHAVEDLCDRVSGVKDVHNHLRVQKEGSGSGKSGEMRSPAQKPGKETATRATP